MKIRKRVFRSIGIGASCLAAMLLIGSPVHAGDGFKIKEAKWDSEKSRLKVKGKGKENKTVTLMYASDHSVINSQTIDDDEWKFKENDLTVVPCKVRAVQSDGKVDEKKVKDAPSDCDSGDIAGGGDNGGGDNGGGDNGGGGNGGGTPPPANGNYTILAANDLGMHCADTDYRLFSILPPYNVLNAQVLLKGSEPKLMSPADGIQVTYKAVNANIIDPNNPNLPPIAMDSINTTSQNALASGIYKGNFWDLDVNGQTLGFLAYQSLYPPGILALFPLDPDTGLPAPDLERLYLGDGVLSAEQSKMPGIADPFNANDPQPFHGYVENLPFFTNFPFGYVVENFQRYTAEGVAMSPIDDQGRSNPYPLMRVEARDASGTVLAAVDTVVPVASEADCQICHAVQNVCDFDTTNTLVCDDIANSNYPSNIFVESAEFQLGETPEQKVINSAKLNILRLHDYKHSTSLAGANIDGSFADGTTPNVVCASCHYSPALDLAHLGPNDENGKEQTQHISMSRAMHGFHGALSTENPVDYGDLFPIMKLPGQRTALETQETLQETCYNCHPGKRTKCLRGAMSDAGIVCQDCHGQLEQVGDDFTQNFPNIAGDADLTKRVPWASEPKCQSCHLGDVLQVSQLASTGMLDDTLVNTHDKAGNSDGLRLQMAYKVSDHKTNGGPNNLALLDFQSSRFAANKALYRLSGGDDGLGKGHEGLSCEGCHGSTHAIWPNANPFSNDNKASNDLQGHTGSITECSTCHEGDLGLTLEGPHGMHPVGATKFAKDHEDLAKNNKNACRACHGANGEGSVLSRTATDRLLESDHKQPDGSKTLFLPKGSVVTCSTCHDNEL